MKFFIGLGVFCLAGTAYSSGEAQQANRNGSSVYHLEMVESECIHSMFRRTIDELSRFLSEEDLRNREPIENLVYLCSQLGELAVNTMEIRAEREKVNQIAVTGLRQCCEILARRGNHVSHATDARPAS